MLCHAKGAAQDALRRRGAEQNYDLRLDGIDLGLQPGPACTDLQRIGFLVQTPLASWLPLEMLDDVGDVNLFAVNPRSRQGFIQHGPCRSNKRSALNIFLVARLLANHHYASIFATFAKHRLRAQFPEIACLAPCGRGAQGRQRGLAGNQGSSCLRTTFGHAQFDASRQSKAAFLV